MLKCFSNILIEIRKAFTTLEDMEKRESNNKGFRIWFNLMRLIYYTAIVTL